jgi:hypothetical protein
MDYFTAVFIKMGRWHNRFTIILKSDSKNKYDCQIITIFAVSFNMVCG